MRLPSKIYYYDMPEGPGYHNRQTLIYTNLTKKKRREGIRTKDRTVTELNNIPFKIVLNKHNGWVYSSETPIENYYQGENKLVKAYCNTKHLLELIKEDIFKKGWSDSYYIWIHKNGKLIPTQIGSKLHKEALEDEERWHKPYLKNPDPGYSYLTRSGYEYIYLGDLKTFDGEEYKNNKSFKIKDEKNVVAQRCYFYNKVKKMPKFVEKLEKINIEEVLEKYKKQEEENLIRLLKDYETYYKHYEISQYMKQYLEYSIENIHLSSTEPKKYPFYEEGYFNNY
jgi:hypothetical protein